MRMNGNIGMKEGRSCFENKKSGAEGAGLVVEKRQGSS